MNLNQVTLPAVDVAASARFYRRMGFTQIVDTPHYARFECPVGEATFSLHAVERPAADTGVVTYFECDDLDARVARLRESGFAFDSGPRDERWRWREARLRDPAGNELCLFYAGEDRRRPPWRVERTGAGE